MQYLKLILTLFTLMSSQYLMAQEESRKQGSIIGIHFHYGIQFPGGDLADRFGKNFTVGAAVDYLTKNNNLIFGLEGSFLFGNQLKENIISNLTTDGNLIGNDRTLADYQLKERGLYIGGRVGKLFPLGGQNKRSGIRATLGLGLLQHKVLLQQSNSRVLQFAGDYAKGYDRLTNGIALTQFVGYQHLSNNRMVNFFIGLEFTQGFTKNRRDYNFNEMQKDDRQRTDLLYGIKVGWTLPFYIGEDPAEIFY